MPLCILLHLSLFAIMVVCFFMYSGCMHSSMRRDSDTSCIAAHALPLPPARVHPVGNRTHDLLLRYAYLSAHDDLQHSVAIADHLGNRQRRHKGDDRC